VDPSTEIRTGTFDSPTRYTYNRDKDLELVTRPDRQSIDFIYNGAGR
jgi:hypothetical protein